MEIAGKIKVLKEIQNIGSNGFRKREVVITTEDQYPQHVLIEFIQDKCDLLNSYTIGEDVKISINIKGEEYINPEGIAKYFNAIQGWRIESLNIQKALAPNLSEVYHAKHPNHKSVESFAKFKGTTYLQELSDKEAQNKDTDDYIKTMEMSKREERRSDIASENFSWGGLEGDEAHDAMWNCD